MKMSPIEALLHSCQESRDSVQDSLLLAETRPLYPTVVFGSIGIVGVLAASVRSTQGNPACQHETRSQG